MRIGDVARRSGLSTSRIRFYERHKLIPTAARTDNGYRDYPASVVDTLEFIRRAQQLGFTLDEIRPGVAQAAGAPASRKKIVWALRQKLAAVERHIDEAVSRRERIIALIAKYEKRV